VKCKLDFKLRLPKSLSDSVYKIEQSNQISELNTKYETESKDAILPDLSVWHFAEQAQQMSNQYGELIDELELNNFDEK
jgi:hypothetical protein